MDRVIFPRPKADNPRLYNHTESPFQWLQESTHQRATAAREFMNRQLTLLPEWLSSRISTDLADKWRGSFFEMIVARLFQELGASLEEPTPNAEGRLADTVADFRGQRLTVEATAIDTNPGLTDDRIRDTQLFPLFDELLPTTWSVMLYELPSLSHSDSKKGLKKLLRRVLPSESPGSEYDFRDVQEVLPEGRLDFTLIPDRPRGTGAVAGGPIYMIGSEIDRRIRKTVRRKRSQIRSEENPVVLAVCLNGSPGRMEDFELALFGRRVARTWPGGEEVSKFQS